MDIIERIKAELDRLQDVEFSKIIEQRLKTYINVNSSNPMKARALLSTDEFANVIGAPVTALRKTIANGFCVLVNSKEYGKPIYLKIRKGGALAAGVGNENGLVEHINAAIQNGVTVINFEDDKGGSLVIYNPISVRNVGSDPGSRTGNRADVEVVDIENRAHRISIKMENATRVAGLTKFLKPRRLKVQRALRDFLQFNQIPITKSGLYSVKITDPQFFKYCWFGLDINEYGGVAVGDFSNSARFVQNGEELLVKCLRIFSPKDNIEALVNDFSTSIYLIMKVDKYYHMDFIGAYIAEMGAKYDLKTFPIEGITSNVAVISEGKVFKLTIEGLRRFLF